MIDLPRLFRGLLQLVRNDELLDARAIGDSLDLDVSGARITNTKNKFITIRDARLRDGGGVVVISGVTPRRLITALFENPTLAFAAIEGETFGPGQRILPSRYSDGFAVVFEEAGLRCGLTVSGENGVVDSVFCQESRPARRSGAGEAAAADGARAVTTSTGTTADSK
jgi:hypothetical protein